MSAELNINSSNTFEVHEEQDTDVKKYRRRSTKSIEFAYDDISYRVLLLQAVFEGIAFFFLTMGIYLARGKPEILIFNCWSIFIIFGSISGAHVNAMFRVCVWLYCGNFFSKYNLVKLFVYIIAQFIGACLGNIFCRLLSDKEPIYFSPKNTPKIKQFVSEAFFSGTIVFIALFVSSASTRPTSKSHVNLILLVVWLYVAIKNGGIISSGNYNPTIYMVFNTIARFYDKKLDAFDEFLALAIAPFVGGVLFMILYKYMFRPFYTRNYKKCITDVE